MPSEHHVCVLFQWFPSQSGLNQPQGWVVFQALRLWGEKSEKVFFPAPLTQVHWFIFLFVQIKCRGKTWVSTLSRSSSTVAEYQRGQPAREKLVRPRGKISDHFEKTLTQENSYYSQGVERVIVIFFCFICTSLPHWFSTGYVTLLSIKRDAGCRHSRLPKNEKVMLTSIVHMLNRCSRHNMRNGRLDKQTTIIILTINCSHSNIMHLI